MSEDRKAVEQAIEWARVQGKFFSPSSHYSTLADAAEKWLATLPEPQWKVRAWMGASGAFQVAEWRTEQDALLNASDLFEKGARKVEIEKP